MADNTIGWGQGSVNNSNGWGAGASNNLIDWGEIHGQSYGHDETNLTGEAPLPKVLVLSSQNKVIAISSQNKILNI